VSYRCRGFRFAGIASGVKNKKQLDLGMIASDRPVSTAAVFTKNKAAAAPVRLSQSLLKKSEGRTRAVIVNSGNANACTGREGSQNAREMVRLSEEALGLDKGEVLVASTGVIGVPLSMGKIRKGIPKAADTLLSGGIDKFAEAILTTDRGTKIAQRRIAIDGKRITLLGCTKGAGMIAPNMATTLSFVVTDAKVSPRALDQALRTAVTPTFNAISVDGDTSTNDMILTMSSGAAGGSSLRGTHLRQFTSSLTDLLDELARKLMRDGEGVHHVVDVFVRGTKTDRAARQVARTIANSPLVKTAISGCDPNWGRILAAAGRSGVPLKLDKANLRIGSVPVLVGGEPSNNAKWEKQASDAMRKSEYPMILDLGMGAGRARYLACDLSKEYVKINADYRS
jgi:glutamate N-acetyltransferase/amino-acid N-acetyltransferase